MNDKEDTGYGKPPKTHQWGKGQSGNPKGRPKAKLDYVNDYAKILSEPVSARRPNGRKERLDGLEATYLQLCRKALKGDNAALFSAIKIMLEILPEGRSVLEARAEEVSGAKEKFIAMAMSNSS